MVFNSVIFIFCFLPIFLLIYYFVPARARNPVLFAGSLFFYAWGDPTYLVLMLFSSFFNYYMGKELGKITDEDPSRKRNLIFAVVINLLILGFFKYWGFLLDTVSGVTGLKLTYPQLALPIGLSFYTFKNLSYILDIYMGKTEPCKGFFPYAVYSTMFPHMTAGPIVRYTDISESISRRSINTTRLGAGAELFIKGLSKKVLLAVNLSALYTTLQASGTTSFVGTWLAIGAYTLELYFDFSGYSDMAIGLGQMLGFNFNKNFDYPYISTSVSEFWRRWHISLGSWFRDYIYIPLGGNRVSTGRHIRNILVVWALTGLWHGASWNFVFWGVYYGLLLLASQFIYHVCRDHRLGIFQPDHTCNHRKNAGSHVWIGSFLLRRPCLPVCTEIRTDPDDHFRDQLPSGALPVFQAPCKTQYLPCRSDKRNPVFPLYCVYDLQFLHTIYVSAVLERV